MEERHFEIDLPEDDLPDSPGFKDYWKQALGWSLPIVVVSFIGSILFSYFAFSKPMSDLQRAMETGQSVYVGSPLTSLLVTGAVMGLVNGVFLYLGLRTTMKTIQLQTYTEKLNFCVAVYLSAFALLVFANLLISGSFSSPNIGFLNLVVLFIVPLLVK